MIDRRCWLTVDYGPRLMRLVAFKTSFVNTGRTFVSDLGMSVFRQLPLIAGRSTLFCLQRRNPFLRRL
jgi:hypothetical protein